MSNTLADADINYERYKKLKRLKIICRVYIYIMSHFAPFAKLFAKLRVAVSILILK